MKHSLHVLIRAGARPGPVRIEVEGCLTPASCTDLICILDHGTRLAGCSQIWVDLHSLDHMELAGVATLKEYVRRRESEGEHCPRISIYAPSMSRPCPGAPGHGRPDAAPSPAGAISRGWR